VFLGRAIAPVCALAFAVGSGCSGAEEASPPSSTTSTTTSSETAELDIAEVNFGDLSVADDPVLRALAEEDRSSWRRSDELTGLEQEARGFLEDPSGPNVRIEGPPTSWMHTSGEVAVQYEIIRDVQAVVVTVLFTPSEV
jgi:hypothetical protein